MQIWFSPIVGIPNVSFPQYKLRPFPSLISSNTPFQQPTSICHTNTKMERSCICYGLTALFILLQFTTYMNSCSATRPLVLMKMNTQYIKSSCNATLYPKLCYRSLSNYSYEIETSPKLLARTALNVTLAATRSASRIMRRLSRSRGLRPIESAAVRDCVEVLGDSVYELQKSIKEMGETKGSNFELQMSDIQTWVSAALTDADTCTDGFAGKAMNGGVKTLVRQHVQRVAHLTSIALAFINNYASGHFSSPN